MIPRLMPWSSSPPPGDTSTMKRSTIAATSTSDCPTPTVSTSTTSKPAASQSSMRLARAPGDAAERAAGGRRAHERVRRAGELLHARLVAEDRAAGARARRVDREHRDAVAGVDEVQAERLDERRLARAGRAGDADAHRVPRRAGSTSASSASASARWSARVDSTSVIARASARRSPAASCSARAAARAPTPARAVRPRRSRPTISRGGGGDVGAGAEDRGDAGLAELVVVLRRDHAAAHDEDVVAALLAQLRDELGHERLVAGGLARHADDVHVVLDRVARRLLGRLEERADVDVEAEVGERGGDHLGAAVVAVLAELGDEDARAATASAGELVDRALHRPRSSSSPS